MSEGGNILLMIYDIINGPDDIEPDKDTILKIENYLNQFDAAFTPGRGAKMLMEWKSSHPEQYHQLGSTKNVDNWININKNNLSKNKIPERESLLKLCLQTNFANGDIKNVNALLYAFNYDGLHVRSPRDAIYYFALKKQLSLEETQEALDHLNWSRKSHSESSKKWKSSADKDTNNESASNRNTIDRRSTGGRSTGKVQKEIDKCSTLDELLGYIQEQSDKFGPIKVEAYETAVKKYEAFLGLDKFKKAKIKTLAQKQEKEELEYQEITLFDPDHFDPDAWEEPSNERNRNIAKWFCQSAGIYNKNKDKKAPGRKNTLLNLKDIRNRSIPIRRGEFIILELFLPQKNWPISVDEESAVKEKLLQDIDQHLYQCVYDRLNEERGVFDKIILDCIDASVQMGYPIENNYIFIDILNSFFDYLQEKGQSDQNISEI